MLLVGHLVILARRVWAALLLRTPVRRFRGLPEASCAKGNPGRRMNETAPAELAESIRTHGLLQSFIAHDLSGFGFSLPLTEGARWATVVSGKAALSSRRLPVTRFPPRRVQSRPVGLVASHQRDPALLCRGAPKNSADGLLGERRQRGPDHLCHLQWLQRAARMAEPYPPPFYTSSLTSP